MRNDGSFLGEKSLNGYMRKPLLYDFLIAALVFGLLYHFLPATHYKSNQENNILYLVSVDVSLSGFVIAALTILVTVKANSQYKPIEAMKTGVDFLFSTPLYKTLIQVFLWCTVEFVIVAFSLFLVNFFYIETRNHIVAPIFVAALIVSFLTVVRTIGILASAVMIQSKSN